MTTPPQDKHRPDTRTDASRDLGEAEVLEYLRRHPDFFLRNDSLLADLELPHNAQGAVSLIERQLSVMRTQRQELKRKLQQLTQTAHTNENLLDRIIHLIFSLLEVRDNQQLLQRLRESLQEDFHTDAVELKLFNYKSPGREHDMFVRVIERATPVCGYLGQEQKQFLFGQAADEIASAAVIPLLAPQASRCLGMLAIGSVDPHRFHAEMGTTFLHYLGAVLARLLLRNAPQ